MWGQGTPLFPPQPDAEPTGSEGRRPWPPLLQSTPLTPPPSETRKGLVTTSLLWGWKGAIRIHKQLIPPTIKASVAASEEGLGGPEGRGDGGQGARCDGESPELASGKLGRGKVCPCH